VTPVERAIALAVVHYRETTTVAITFATRETWQPIMNPDGSLEPPDRAIELNASGFVLAHLVRLVLDDPPYWERLIADCTDPDIAHAIDSAVRASMGRTL
jgi:hypothetical protein